jgi:hypothetical protein
MPSEPPKPRDIAKHDFNATVGSPPSEKILPVKRPNVAARLMKPRKLSRELQHRVANLLLLDLGPFTFGPLFQIYGPV